MRLGGPQLFSFPRFSRLFVVLLQRLHTSRFWVGGGGRQVGSHPAALGVPLPLGVNEERDETRSFCEG